MDKVNKYREIIRHQLASLAAFVLPAKATLEPATWKAPIARQATVERELTLTLGQNVPIGDLRITYRITSDGPRFSAQGPIFLSVDAAKE
jgi:hypothetical protein